MRAATNRRRWVRTAVMLAVAVLGSGTVAATAVPTAALAKIGGSYQQCFESVTADGEKLWVCVPIHTTRPICDDCPEFAIGFDHVVRPPEGRFAERIGGGFGWLDAAALAEDPREATQLRLAAQESFLGAAEALAGAEVQLGAVGILDRERNVIEPDPQPWLVAAGTDLVDGVRLMQQALADPDPTPWLEAAMDQFAEAYQELAQQEVIGP